MLTTDIESPPPANALLSVEDSRRLVRELHCWSTSAQEAVRSLLQRQFDAWRGRWGLDTDTTAPSGRVRLEPAEAPAAAALSDAEARLLLAVRMFGDASVAVRPGAVAHGAAAPMATEIAIEAWADWTASLQAMAPSHLPASGDRHSHASSSAAAEPYDPWDGRLHFSFDWWDSRWSFVLDARSVETMLAVADIPRPPQSAVLPGSVRVSPTQALTSHRLAVRVELHPVSIDLGQLGALVLGDVLTLSHPLDLPARVLLDAPDGPHGAAEALCCAWLGQSRGRMALELAPLINR